MNSPSAHSPPPPPGVRQKRIYDEPSPGDGERILVMRRWPRGVKKERVGAWLRELAPSVGLVHDFLKVGKLDFETYRARYLAEIGSRPEALAALESLAERVRAGATVTFLCWCRDESRCHRSILVERLSELASRRPRRR